MKPVTLCTSFAISILASFNTLHAQDVDCSGKSIARWDIPKCEEKIVDLDVHRNQLLGAVEASNSTQGDQAFIEEQEGKTYPTVRAETCMKLYCEYHKDWEGSTESYIIQCEKFANCMARLESDARELRRANSRLSGIVERQRELRSRSYPSDKTIRTQLSIGGVHRVMRIVLLS